jgi:ABC-2 type transport system permease protein
MTGAEAVGPVAPGGEAAHMDRMAVQDVEAVRPPEPRRYQGVNWLGLKTLYVREVRRFFKVGMQTVLAPVVTTLLYMLIFVVAMQGANPPVEGTPFEEFVAPGLVMMAILNNAFSNSSSSLIQAKIMGTAPDFLTPPLSPFEQAAGFAMGAATRGVLVGAVTGFFVYLFAPIHIEHVWAIAWFGLTASLMMAFVGVIAGLWSEKFDHLAAVTNFIIVPMTFLSGTFYLIDRLPYPFDALSRFNPFFYLIDGFRYGFIGHADSSLAIGVAVSGILTVALGVVCWMLFRRGWRLKT